MEWLDGEGLSIVILCGLTHMSELLCALVALSV